MTRLLISVALVLSICCAVPAQDPKAAQNQKLLEEAAKKGTQVPLNITVKNNVSAQAVLIPQIDARRIFGKEIADHYAVIELNVGNKSPDAALIIHGVFIDYSRWGLSGSNQFEANTVDGVAQNSFEQFQASTNTNHVASEEYRIVRGQLEDAKLWSKRAWTMRLLTLAGSLASAYTFSLNEQGIIKGIAAFSGVFVPGVDKAWPDGTQEQLNRISDYGYKTNKVIPKQSGEIIVCFFPIDRFLTPGFKRLFLKSPALFFNPKQMLLDRTIEGDVKKVLGEDFGKGINLKSLRNLSGCYERLALQHGDGSSINTKPATIDRVHDDRCLISFGLVRDNNGVRLTDKDKFLSFQVLDFISQMSLNNVRVTIDGAMTLDTSSMAPKIEGLKFDQLKDCGGDQSPCFWSDLTKANAVRTGTILGSYLTGGTIEMAEAKDLGITDLKTESEGSSDQLLNFSFKLSKPIPSGMNLHFKVTKALTGAASLNAATTESKSLEYLLSGPVITDISYEASTRVLTLTGTGFSTSPLSPVIKLRPPGGDDKELKTLESSAKAPTTLVFKLPVSTGTTGGADAISAGCWTVLAFVGDQPVKEPEKKTILVVPTLDTAKLTGTEITLTGTGLDAGDCNAGRVTFTLVNGNESKNLAKVDGSTATTVKLGTLPAGATKDWKLKVVFDGKELTKSPLALTVTTTP